MGIRRDSGFGRVYGVWGVGRGWVVEERLASGCFGRVFWSGFVLVGWAAGSLASPRSIYHHHLRTPWGSPGVSPSGAYYVFSSSYVDILPPSPAPTNLP